MRAKQGLVAGVFLLSSIVPAAGAKGAGPLSVEADLGRGERVFVGQVIDATTRWGEGRKMIWTDYRFHVEDPWTPGLAREEVLSVVGGTIDDEAIEVSHAPRFEVGETYLVSAWRNDHLYYSAVVGGDRGYFRRAVDEATMQEVFVTEGDLALEVGRSGEVEPGPLAEPAGRPGLVRFPGTAELAARANAGGEPIAGSVLPVYRDPAGRIVPPLPVPADPEPGGRCLAGRAELRQTMERGRALLAARGWK